MISTILSDAWRVFREQFGVIAAIVVVVCLPCELFSSYYDAFFLGPDDFALSVYGERFLDHLTGTIATAGVTFIALTARAGESASFGSAINAGFRAWGRTWWTGFLSGLAIIFG